LITSIVSLIGFLVNILVMALILLHGRRKYHILFSLLLLIAASWDLGILLIMIRNSYPEEILIYQNIISIPMNFLPALSYHFTTTYLNQPRRKSTIVIYAYCLWGFILVTTGMFKPVSGVYTYSWGTVARYDPNFGNLSWPIVTYLTIIISCWLLLEAHKREPSPLTRRHIRYILISFTVFTVAHLKILLTYGVDLAFLLPLGMLLIDSFGALIGVAILKEKLFDITVLVREGIIYSILTAVAIFAFDFSQHLIGMSLEGLVGRSEYARYIAIAVVVVIFMPVKQRVERSVRRLLSDKKVEL